MPLKWRTENHPLDKLLQVSRVCGNLSAGTSEIYYPPISYIYIYIGVNIHIEKFR